MSICHLITILALALLIQTSHPFKPPKHNIISYYKTVNNVFLTNPFNHTTGYGIYVAGETTTVDIPSNVANVYDIVNWKVVNVDKDRLMFVHNNKPQIMINQKTIKNMKFSGELSGSLIAFGDNVALHVPTIYNFPVVKPYRVWNYIELLHFDAKHESVRVIDALPWLKDDDWNYILEWTMTDYIHLDNKLYLLIKRGLFRALFTQEISIIRLCLDKGMQLITTATEIHYSVNNFMSDYIIDALFQEIRQLPGNSYGTAILFIEQETPYRNRTYSKHALNNFLQLFDLAETECHLQSNEATLLRYYLRSESHACQKLLHEPCGFNAHLVTSFDVTSIENVLIKFRNEFELGFEEYVKSTYTPSAVPSERKIQFFGLHFPLVDHLVFNPTTILLLQNIFDQSLGCSVSYDSRPSCFVIPIKGDYQLKCFVNQRPLGFFYVAKASSDIIFTPRTNLCTRLTTCIDCIMYGIYLDCVWTTTMCVYSNETKNYNHLTNNYCFKVKYVSPLQLNTSSSTTLTIKLDRPLDLTADKQLVITVGLQNHCIKIFSNKLVIKCSMNLFKSGRFNVKVNIVNNKYGQVAIVSASSIKKVDIVATEVVSKSIIFVGLLYALVVSSFLLWIVYARYIKKRSKRFLVREMESLTIKKSEAGKIVSHKSQLKELIYKKKKSRKKASRKRSRKLVDTSIGRVGSEILSSLLDNEKDSAIPHKSSSATPRNWRKR